MNHDEYLSCNAYENRGDVSPEGIVKFFDAPTKSYYFAFLDASGKVLLKSESYPTEAPRDNGVASVIKNRTDETNYIVVSDEVTGMYYMSLRAKNYREIARSCDAKTEAEAQALLPYLTMQKVRGGKSSREEDTYLMCSEYEKRGEAEEGYVSFYDEAAKSYLFAVVDKKGKVLFRSETYPSAKVRDNGIESVKKNRELKERYSVIQDETGAYCLIIKAGNHKEIARSCPFASEAEAWAVLTPANAKSQGVDDDYLDCSQYLDRGQAEEDGIVSFYDEESKSYLFALMDSDGKVLFRSECYPTAGARETGIASVRKNRALKERYAVIKDEGDGKYYTIIKAGNHKEIARSCPQDNDALVMWMPPLVAAVSIAEIPTVEAPEPEIVMAAPLVAPPVVEIPVVEIPEETVEIPAVEIPTVEAPEPEIVMAAPLVAPPVVETPKVEIPEEKVELEDDYLPCTRYSNRGLPDADGIVTFYDENSSSYLFAVVNARGKILLRSEKFATEAARKQEMDSVRLYQKDRSYYSVIQNPVNSRHYVVLKNKEGREIGRSCSYEQEEEAWFMVPPVPPVPVVESPDLTIPLVVAAAAVIPTVVSAIDVPSVEVPPAVVEKKAAPLMPPPPIIEPVAAPIAAPIAAGGGFQWWWLLPLLLLPLFWWLFSKGCNEPKVAVVPPKVETVVTPPPAVDTLKRETAPKVAETKIGNIVLRSIFFDFDKSDLRPVSQSDLDNLVKVLQENPTYNAELKAFTDAKGSDAYNRALSMRRANNAKSYVVSKGIAKNRIKTSTFGESNPIAKNEVNGQDTEEGRQFNRRVEVAVFDSAGKQVGLVEQIAVPESLKK